MRYEGDRTIPARREQVWVPITDPATLLACIPGAEKIERQSETEYEGVIRQQVGGVTVALSGYIRMDELHPPERLSFTGVGTDDRTNSRMEVDVDVALEPAGTSTSLEYVVDVAFAGKLARFGSRVLARQVKTNIETFFDTLVAHVGDGDEPPVRASRPVANGERDGR